MKIPAREKLLRERENNELTQEEAGLLIGVSQCYVSQLEKGRRTPGMSLAKKIQIVFKVNMEEW